MPTIPAPVFALVGVGDAAAEMARELPERIEKIDVSKRIEMMDLSKVELPKFELPKVDVAKLDPRHYDIKVELPDMSDVAVYFLDVAAKAEKSYDEFVVRGEQVVAQMRGTEHVTAPVAKPVSATRPATKKATPRKPAAKKTTTRKTTAKKTTRKATTA